MSRQWEGLVQQAPSSPTLKIKSYIFNMPFRSAIKVILAKSMNATFVQPNPAMDLDVRSHPQEINIVAGFGEWRLGTGHS